ncbi:CHAT domain-containing protein [Geminocystis sp.]|uniref:CHAT domain-containing protein n=1 Tax=Geminocystis sp. TaxID=2664100 RepID=UPI0035940AF9
MTIILNLSSVNAQLIPEDKQEAILNSKMLKMEEKLENEYETFFQRNMIAKKQSSLEMASILADMDEKTGTNSAILWVIPEEKYLHLVYLTKKGKIIVRDINDAPFEKITKTIDDFYIEIDQINNPINLTQSQQLYNWIIKPFQQEFLDAENINNILFCIGNGVRLLPLSALHDGNNFLVEKYSITRIPAFNLINAQYKPMKNAQILAMGASNFPNEEPLPAVTLELENIVQKLAKLSSKSSQLLLNEDLTLNNMESQLQTNGFQIVHLATHANFNTGDANNSYIQLWDDKLTLDKMSNLPWKTPPDLLVLSACNTALGDRSSQLGFTGIALQSGVNSALGTLWSVSDLGTFALITEFYQQLVNPSDNNMTKTEALRQAQNLLLQEKIYFENNYLITPHGNIKIPESLEIKKKITLSHPFYWAGFTLISSPW